MADLTAPASKPSSGGAAHVVGRWWQGASLALRVAIVYLVARTVTTVFFVVSADLSAPSSRFGEGATLGSLSIGWDAQWYWFVAEYGYPTELPVTESGEVAENQWAFMPIYSYLAKGLGIPLQSWGLAAVLISLAAGYGACVVLYRLLRPRLDDSAAMWAVVFFAFGPLAAMFQVGYAESLFLLLLLFSLWAVTRRRYAWLYLLIPLMGFTRPGILAFALFLALHGLHRWFTRRRDPLPVRDGIQIIVAGLLAVVVGFSWQVIAAIVTRDPGAYLATELAWRRNWLGEDHEGFIPFDGFVQASAFWLQTWGFSAEAGYIALGVLVAGLAGILLFEPHVRRVGPEIRLWSASYLVYILLVFFPQSSIFRLLLPLSPLWGALAVPRSPWWRGGVLLACVGGQWWWIYNMYALGNTFWQIP